MPDIERGAGRGGRRRAAGQEARSGRPYHRSIFTRTADSSSIISPPLTPSHRRVPTPSDKAEEISTKSASANTIRVNKQRKIDQSNDKNNEIAGASSLLKFMHKKRRKKHQER
uniref:Disease resistance protein RPM1-like n=1 Tax=Oryza sativa subsp. japonica TaxID=39947 RepID=Q6ZB26_ORYSJ|nr:disease resistance protein RPM1-like [Oryza sativa Japonica Group]